MGMSCHWANTTCAGSWQRMIAFMRRDDKHKHCDHDWQYYEDPDPMVQYTGYLERCKHCGAISQIPQ
jgi:hypothetical protein